MKKEPSKETDIARDAELVALARLPDDRINTSDIPKQPDWRRAKRSLFYRPVKQQG